MKKTLLLLPAFGLMGGALFAQSASDEASSPYEDGMFILNEGWFGHEGGSLNYLSGELSPSYRVFAAANPGLSLGNTSCCAIVYGGKLFVSSKQAYDGGDGGSKGGRFVVADAKTLRCEASLDELPGGGDGRSLVGVMPGKVYAGTTAGIAALTEAGGTWSGQVIEGTYGDDNYGQTGDMLKAGGYVFALQMNTGVHVIDAATDRLVTTIAEPDAAALTQSMDGTVWMATESSLIPIDPSTLETGAALLLPSGGGINGTWSAWKPASLCASATENVIYWNGGGSSWAAGADYYRYVIGDDIASAEPFFSLSGLQGITEADKQEAYGTARIDSRTGALVVPTVQSGWGANYQHTWIHVVDGTTGEMLQSTKLEEAYWFPELPVFPDKYAPEAVGLDALSLNADGETAEIDLGEKLIDRDNLAFNIGCTLASAGNAEVADVTLDGRTLSIAPKAKGETTVTLRLESNGVETLHDLLVKVEGTSGIGAAEGGRDIRVAAGAVEFSGYAGWTFTLYNASGQAAATFRIDSERCSRRVEGLRGVCLLKGTNGSESTVKKLLF